MVVKNTKSMKDSIKDGEDLITKTRDKIQEMEKRKVGDAESWSESDQNELSIEQNIADQLASMLRHQMDILKTLREIAENHYLIGSTQFFKLEHDKAIASYKMALKFDPEHKDAQTSLNELLQVEQAK